MHGRMHAGSLEALRVARPEAVDLEDINKQAARRRFYFPWTQETLATSMVRSSSAGSPAVNASSAASTSSMRAPALRWQFSIA